MGVRKQPLSVRFWGKVDSSGDCWLWTADLAPTGYGRINVDGNVEYAHRVAYRLTHGEIPAGLDVMHTCDNPPCVCPTHLRIGTRKDNMQDCKAKNRHFVPPRGPRSTHCVHGHEKAYTRGGRGTHWHCPECNRIRARGGRVTHAK